MPDIKIQELDPTNESIMTQIRAIYENSFRIEERVPWELMAYDFTRKRRKGDETFHLIGILQGNRVIGFSTSVFYWDFTYGGYIAIEKTQRHQGLGSHLVMKIKDLAIQDAQNNDCDLLVLFEVEKPVLARNKKEKEEIARRLQFYKKFNVIYLDVEYIEPPLLGKELPMYLAMITSGRDYIESERLINCVKLIYKYEYYLPARKREKYLKILRDSINAREKVYRISVIS